MAMIEQSMIGNISQPPFCTSSNTLLSYRYLIRNVFSTPFQNASNPEDAAIANDTQQPLTSKKSALPLYTIKTLNIY